MQYVSALVGAQLDLELHTNIRKIRVHNLCTFLSICRNEDQPVPNGGRCCPARGNGPFTVEFHTNNARFDGRFCICFVGVPIKDSSRVICVDRNRFFGLDHFNGRVGFQRRSASHRCQHFLRWEWFEEDDHARFICRLWIRPSRCFGVRAWW